MTKISILTPLTEQLDAPYIARHCQFSGGAYLAEMMTLVLRKIDPLIRIKDKRAKLRRYIWVDGATRRKKGVSRPVPRSAIKAFPPLQNTRPLLNNEVRKQISHTPVVQSTLVKLPESSSSHTSPLFLTSSSSFPAPEPQLPECTFS